MAAASVAQQQAATPKLWYFSAIAGAKKFSEAKGTF